MNLCVRSYFKPNLISSFFRFSTSVSEIGEASEQVIFEDPDDTQAKEAELEAKRNKSRLSSAHFNITHGRRPYETPMCLAHKTVKYNRKLYGKYGSVSGINPSLCWPSKQDIQEKLAYENVAFPYTIPQMMQMAAEKRKEQQLKIETREREVGAKFDKLAQWKKELRDKINKKTADAQAAKDKKERLVEEVRRHFGFKLDPRDERFQEMLAKREKEQKKLEKLAKKEAKEKMMIAKLQQQNAELK